MNENVKKPNIAAIIMKRELSSYFSSPIAYIVICMNIIILSLAFFKGLFLGYNFFLYKSADLRILFLFQSILLTLFIPIITMRLFSEEKRTGSMETLMTLPLTEMNVVLGKTLAAFVTSLIVIAPSLFIPILISFCGKLDFNQIIAGYLGLILLSALFSTIGVFASSITKHQIVSLFISLPACAVLMSIYVPFSIPKSVPHFIDEFFKFLSTYEHFTSISHGIVDTRDILYFVCLTVFFFCLTVVTQQKERS
ncbi:MAG: ABC transporter permease [Treponema sp.]|nr:ABC transporter permease [Treponema sp.]